MNNTSFVLSFLEPVSLLYTLFFERSILITLLLSKKRMLNSVESELPFVLYLKVINRLAIICFESKGPTRHSQLVSLSI